jgi:hypothetical protein
MPVSSGPGGPARYRVPYTGGIGYHSPLPYSGGSAGAPGHPALTAMYSANQVHLLNQIPMLPLANPFLPFPEPEYALREVERPAFEHVMSTVAPADSDPSAKEVTKLTDDLTAACLAGKITIEQAIQVSLSTADVLEAGSNRAPALKNLKAELRVLRVTSTLSADEFRKISDEVDALIRQAQ